MDATSAMLTLQFLNSGSEHCSNVVAHVCSVVRPGAELLLWSVYLYSDVEELNMM